MLWLSFLNDIVIPTFVEMDDELPDAILNYFEPIFIGVRTRNGKRGEPRIPIQFWKVRDMAEADIARTNNLVKG